jgi:hypothetical protein
VDYVRERASADLLRVEDPGEVGDNGVEMREVAENTDQRGRHEDAET